MDTAISTWPARARKSGTIAAKAPSAENTFSISDTARSLARIRLADHAAAVEPLFDAATAGENFSHPMDEIPDSGILAVGLKRRATAGAAVAGRSNTASPARRCSIAMLCCCQGD